MIEYGSENGDREDGVAGPSMARHIQSSVCSPLHTPLQGIQVEIRCTKMNDAIYRKNKVWAFPAYSQMNSLLL